jgi:hypothetical protein
VKFDALDFISLDAPGSALVEKALNVINSDVLVYKRERSYLESVEVLRSQRDVFSWNCLLSEIPAPVFPPQMKTAL